MERNIYKIGKELFITSDEEIKIGDYFYQSFDSIIHKCYKLTDNYVIAEKPSDYPKKICKKIILTTDTDLIKDGVQAIDDEFLEWFVKNPSCKEVEIDLLKRGIYDEYKYKIIIPKEEQKQHLINMMKADEELGLYEEPKKETLDEVARVSFELGYDKGARWQQERSYSEEEVENIAWSAWYESQFQKPENRDEEGFNKWFEQFKKK